MSERTKVFRDPIYNLISFDKEEKSLLIDLLNCPEVQRLKRIRQLGVSNLTYTSATHDRFTHSVGVCHLVGKILDSLYEAEDVHIPDMTDEITLPTPDFKLLLQAAGLLHDIGHGPFSHTFEKISKVKHEKISSEIILNNKNIGSAFAACNNQYIQQHGPRWITEILDGTFPVQWAKEIISSQLDADRIDYLLRDAYMCGVKYATFDVDWLLLNMEIQPIPPENNREGIVINSSKGLHSLESFIVSRYHMYEQVYFHKTTRGFEQLLSKIFQRAVQLMEEGQPISFIDNTLPEFIKDNNNIDLFLRLDDFYMITQIHAWAREAQDVILKDLSEHFICRKPYRMISESNESQPITNDKYSELKANLGDAFSFCYLEDNYIDNPYKDTYLLGKSTAEESEKIWVYTKDGIQELSEQSNIIKSLKNNVSKKSRAYLHRNYLNYWNNGGGA